MTDIPFYWLDVFKSEPFRGNPAAVCMMKTDRADSLYQNIAKELGLAETAFAEKIGTSLYKLIWFTPKWEARLCGHATMATAYTLAEEYGARAVYYTLTLRYTRRNQDLQLETRQAQLFMQLYNRWTDPIFALSNSNVRYNERYQWADVNDLQKKVFNPSTQTC